jgi:hypothetical protein
MREGKIIVDLVVDERKGKLTFWRNGRCLMHHDFPKSSCDTLMDVFGGNARNWNVTMDKIHIRCVQIYSESDFILPPK